MESPQQLQVDQKSTIVEEQLVQQSDELSKEQQQKEVVAADAPLSPPIPSPTIVNSSTTIRSEEDETKQTDIEHPAAVSATPAASIDSTPNDQQGHELVSEQQVSEPINGTSSPGSEKHDLVKDEDIEESNFKRQKIGQEEVMVYGHDVESKDVEMKDVEQVEGEAVKEEVSEQAKDKEEDEVKGPAADSAASSSFPKHQQKFALSTIRAVKRLKDAGPFLVPVDPVKLNIPTYLDVVKNPMDLGTIEKKLVDEQYTSIQDFINDVELIVANCTSFNGPDSFVTNMVKNVKASFDKHMAHLPPVDVPPPPPHKQKKKSLAPVNTPPKSQRVAAAQAAAAAQQQQEQQQQQQEGENSEPKPFALQPSGIPTIRRDSSVDSGRPKREIHPPKSRDLPYGDIKPRKKKFAAELRFCGQVLKELQSKKHEAYSFPFLQPVDPVALNCPTYFKIIKQPMDLSTVYDKLQTNRYETAEEFFTDVKLIFKNCYKFNVEGSAVNVMGHKLEQVFDKLWADKPVQPPTPPPQAEFSDFDDSDFDEDAAIAAAMNNPAIRYMEQQLGKMQADLDQMRRDVIREAKEKRRKPSSTKKGRRKSGVKDSSAKRKSSTGPGKRPRSNSNEKEIQVTYEMKQELTDKIGELPEKKLHRVVAIIQESLPNLNNGSDEIELDIDQLDTQTIIKLYNFVVRKDENSSSSKPTKKSSTTKRKSRPLTEDEQNRQIQELQDKLKQFDQAAGGAAQDEQQESSSDEDDQESDESSEEE